MATAFPKRTVLATPNTRVAFQTARVESTRPVLRTSPSKNVVGAPNGSYTTLPGSPRNTASRSYRSNWPSAEDLAYDAEYMKVVIDSQKVRIVWNGKCIALICRLLTGHSIFLGIPAIYGTTTQMCISLTVEGAGLGCNMSEIGISTIYHLVWQPACSNG